MRYFAAVLLGISLLLLDGYSIAATLYYAKTGAVAFEQPSTSSSVLYKFQPNEEIKGMGEEPENWIKVKFSTGQVGYVEKTQVAPSLLTQSAEQSGSGSEDNTNAPSDGDRAPFGLVWGLSEKQVRARGITLTDKKATDYGDSYTAANLPRVLSDTALVNVFFGYNDKLWRIIAVSKTFEDDPYGVNVKSRYEEVKNTLEKRYGTGKVEHYQDSRLWTESREFLMGIKTGNSWHYTNFETPKVFVQLNITALSGSDAVYVIISENKELKATYKQNKSQKEEDAL